MSADLTRTTTITTTTFAVISPTTTTTTNAAEQPLIEQAIEAKKNKDYQGALDILRPLASKQLDNHVAQRELGEMYDKGLGVDRDYDKAKKYYKRASAEPDGDANALYKLGILSFHGRGGHQNDSKAMDYFDMAISKGCHDAWIGKGLLFEKGFDERTKIDAMECYQEAINNGVARAKIFIGHLYKHGHGVEKNPGTALDYYVKAAVSGEPDAWNDVGVLYENGLIDDKPPDLVFAMGCYDRAIGEGSAAGHLNRGRLLKQEKKYVEAKVQFEEAARHGDINALTEIGSLYREGNGVSKDIREVKKYFELAADANDGRGLWHLGNLYETGENGDCKSDLVAYEFYERAGNAGYAGGWNSMGWLCYMGGEGIAKDYNEAVKLFKRASNEGHEESWHNMGIAYRFGRGVKQDRAKSIYHYRQAERLGVTEATKSIRTMQNDWSWNLDHEAEFNKLFASVEKGNAEAQYQVGLKYKNDTYVEKDLEEAKDYFRKAAEQSHSGAAFELYKLCKGTWWTPATKADQAEAEKWLQLAASNGHPEALKITTEREAEVKKIKAKKDAEVEKAKQKAKEKILARMPPVNTDLGVNESEKDAEAEKIKAKEDAEAGKAKEKNVRRMPPVDLGVKDGETKKSGSFLSLFG